MEKYEKSVAELESLVKKIEDTSRPMKEISSDVKKAVKLLAECRDLLRGEESKLSELLDSEKK